MFRRTLGGMLEWDQDFDHQQRPPDERSRRHTLRLGVLVVAAGIVTLLMVVLIGPLFAAQ